MAAITDEKTILADVLAKQGPDPLPPAPDPVAIDTLNQFQCQIGTDNGVAPMDSGTRSQIVATTSPTDAEEDRLYTDFLERDAAIANASVAPQVFTTLSQHDGSLSALETASNNASAVYIQIIRDQNQHNEPIYDLVQELYIATQTQPAAASFRPGITVGDMAFFMANALRVFASAAQNQKTRSARTKTRTQKAGAQISQTQQSVADQASVARLRSHATAGALPNLDSGE